MSSIRQRRLLSDYHRVIKCLTAHPYIHVEILEGIHPEQYRIKYDVKGVMLEKGESTPRFISEHIVEIYLHIDYPRKPPQCIIKTPIFHPNISSGIICVADDINWTPQEDLLQLIFRIGRMIQYQEYNLQSPRDGNAANWVSRNMNEHIFPIDNISLEDAGVDCRLLEPDKKLPPVLPEDDGIVLL